MTVSKAAKIWIVYHRAHPQKNTVWAYKSIIKWLSQGCNDIETGQLAFYQRKHL